MSKTVLLQILHFGQDVVGHGSVCSPPHCNLSVKQVGQKVRPLIHFREVYLTIALAATNVPPL